MATKIKTPGETSVNAAKSMPQQHLTPEVAVYVHDTAGNDGTETISAVVAPVAAPPAVVQNQKWQEIKVILEKLKEDTLREIRKSVKNGTEAVAAIEPGGDIYDQASSERDRELGLLLGDREREKIHNIDEALLRIDDGDYGICEECDEDIPLGRLKAMPFTRHCVKCKSDLEKLQAQTKRVEEERAYREIPLGEDEE
jgi:DnaK suppressor protein